MRRIRDQHRRACGVSAVRVIRLDHAQPGPLAVRSGRGLQRHARHAGDRREHPLQLPHQLQRTLRVRLVLVGMQTGEALERGELLVDHGVVFHGARSERIDALVQIVIAPRKPAEVPGQHGFGHRRNRRWLPAQRACRHGCLERSAWYVGRSGAGTQRIVVAELEDERLCRRPAGLDAVTCHDGTLATDGTTTGRNAPAASRAASTYRSIASGGVISVQHTST